MHTLPRSTTALMWLALPLLALVACGGGQTPAPSPEASTPATASTGQVSPPATATRVSFYAASRFAEQASFGPTPALVAELQAKGFERWIDEQFALPLAPIDMRPAEAIYAYKFNVNPPPPDEIMQYVDRQFVQRAMAGSDQLRMRVTWGLSQFIVATFSKGEPPGWTEWHNLLYRNALGRYDTLLRQASIDSHMGHFLDNDQNRPKSAECQHCAPNENYARELMQLFTIGVNKLNPDGTPQRDNRGRFIETYSQRDVEELARVLTGWTRTYVPGRPDRNWGNWGRPMIPSTWPPDRDSGAKTVLGRSFPAGQSTQKDLDDAIELLMTHPNTPPFVALRLIQHLVKSDPTPAYVGRVAARFADNGAGVRGDLRAVVKAVLLDAEARAGDQPGNARRDDGKFREPFLHGIALWRGLGCSRAPNQNWGPNPAISWTQSPFRQSSVFSFYAPTDRAPGSNLLAPEQRLANTDELRNRSNQASWPAEWRASTGRQDLTRLRDAGCQVDLFAAAFAQSPAAYADLLAQRFFRGAMPPTLRSNLAEIMSQQWPPYNKNDPPEGALRMLSFATLTPYFGVMK